MKKSLICLFISVFLVNCSKNFVVGDVVITNINIIDVKQGKTIPNQTIVIQDDKIASIKPFSEADENKAQTIIDGTGKFVMPGLWDMHAHGITRNGDFSALFVANGVLGVREMSGNLKVRDSFVKANKVMPKDFDSGGVLYGDAPGVPSPAILTVADALNAVDSLYKAGADFIKVYEFLSKDQFNAIAERCAELDIPFAGHLPMEITPIQASNKGQKSIEHLSWITESVSTNSERIDSLKLQVLAHMRGGEFQKVGEDAKKITKLVVDSEIAKSKLEETIATFKKNNTYIVPTLTVVYGRNSMDTLNTANLLHTAYLPKQLVESYKAENTFPYNMFTEEDWEYHHKGVERFKTVTIKLFENGLPIMTGTDAPYSSAMPGFGLHKELQNLVDLGMTNANVLKAATLTPAEYLGIQKSYGTVEPNKIADLLILEKNPLLKIENTKSIAGVIQNGKYMDREVLNNLLKNAEFRE